MRTHGETVCFLYFCVLASVVVEKVIIKNIAIGFNIPLYRSGTLNSNTVNSKFHLIRSFFEIFARLLSFHV